MAKLVLPDPHYDEWQEVPLPTPTDETLQAICTRHGLAGQEISRIKSVGAINAVYKIDNRFVLRLPRRIAEGIRAAYNESVALPVVTSVGIRAPEQIAFDDSLEIVNVPYTIQEFLGGRVLRSGSGLDHKLIYRDLGSELARLHDRVKAVPHPAIRPELRRPPDEGVPLFVRVGRGDRIVPDDIPEVLKEVRDRGYLTVEEQRWFEQSVGRLVQYVEAAAFRRFLHRDAAARNILIWEGSFAALLDWGSSDWGDPVLDFRGVPDEFLTDVIDGYRLMIPVDGDDTAEHRMLWDRLTLCAFALWNPPTSREPGARTSGAIAQLIDLEQRLNLNA